MNDRLYENFGNPEATSDLARWTSEEDNLYIETPSIREFLNGEIHYPFIVGTKGVGKSILLFKKAIKCRKSSGSIQIPGSSQKAFSPTTEFAEMVKWNEYWQLEINNKPNVGAWTRLWEWALLKVIFRYWRIHCEKDKDFKEIGAELEDLVGADFAYDPFQLIANFLDSIDSGSRYIKGKLSFPKASELYRFMENRSNDLPPVYLFVDNQDDFFDDNPNFWIGSGCGTFQAIQNIRRKSNHRIHCFTTLRPEVIWLLKGSEHFPRYEDDIFYIRWNDENLINLMSVRASRLKRNRLCRPDLVDKDPILAFLGPQNLELKNDNHFIKNKIVEGNKPIFEDPKSFILRHTLKRPREIILIGNKIIKTRIDWSDTDRDSSLIICEAVRKVSSEIIAEGYIQEVKHRWPWGEEGINSLSNFIKRYIRKNVITKEEAIKIQTEFSEQIGKPSNEIHPICYLSSFGLIGWPIIQADNQEIQHFPLPGSETITFLPSDINFFFVHPILYGAPFHIKQEKGFVVGRGLPIDCDQLCKLIDDDIISCSTETTDLKSDEKLGDLKVAKDPIRILHLSDFHFTPKKSWDQSAVTRDLSRSIAEFTKNGMKPDVIAITGDVAHSGTKKDYDIAFDWIDSHLLPVCQAKPNSLLMVPGNHDVNRNVVNSICKTFTNKLLHEFNQEDIAEFLMDKEQKGFFMKRLNRWKAFILKFNKKITKKNGYPWWTETMKIKGETITFLGLCTSWMSYSDRDKGRLLLSKYQINSLLDESNKKSMKIALMHHPWDYIADQSVVQEELRLNCDLILHGHLHESQGSYNVTPNNQVLEIGCGACYETSEYPNSFQMIEIFPETKNIRVHFRTWNNHQWIIDRNQFAGKAPEGFADFRLN